jgi:anthranilate/para-aminobenzoate synthase component I/branched-subunit amino acid aminotransferase/4-amino-4-deoxychorismate lyase
LPTKDDQTSKIALLKDRPPRDYSISMSSPLAAVAAAVAAAPPCAGSASPTPLPPLSAWLGFETLAAPLGFGRPAALLVARELHEVEAVVRAAEAAAAERDCHVIGFLAYEAAPAFERAAVVRTRARGLESGGESALEGLPLAYFALFERSEVLVGAPPPGASSAAAAVQSAPVALLASPSEADSVTLPEDSRAGGGGGAVAARPAVSLSPWAPRGEKDAARAEYDAAIGAVRDAIREGET